MKLLTLSFVVFKFNLCVHWGVKKQSPLKVNLSDITEDTKLDIISNLPYNIGTQLLINWIHQIDQVQSITLMLQKEVVDRVVSSHGKKSYGRLSIICQLMCDVEKCFDVSPKAFYPEPKIWSAIVRLVPKTYHPTQDILLKLEQITLQAFSGRRKMIKSSLKKVAPNIGEILELLGLDQSLRAENLSPADYLAIANKVI